MNYEEASSLPTPEFRPLSRTELGLVIEWAAEEGWNPGLHDADAFYAADPEAFWGMEVEGELIGAGAIASYGGGQQGFMGLFIVRREWRGRGLGRRLWYFRRDRLRARLQPGAPISMDGVFAMQPFYASGGFVFSHRNLRMEGIGGAVSGDSPLDAHLVELAKAVPFDRIAAFDERHFGSPRPEFLERWIRPEGGLALGYLDEGGSHDAEPLRGYAVLRPCRVGFKIGPLFAETPVIAEALFVGLSRRARGKLIFLDTPEKNPDALALARRHGMKEVFGCARMVLGAKARKAAAAPPSAPPLSWSSIYGITTFEMG
jgi:GNAT superfamily N-acetyltransferase